MSTADDTLSSSTSTSALDSPVSWYLIYHRLLTITVYSALGYRVGAGNTIMLPPLFSYGSW